MLTEKQINAVKKSNLPPRKPEAPEPPKEIMHDEIKYELDSDVFDIKENYDILINKYLDNQYTPQHVRSYGKNWKLKCIKVKHSWSDSEITLIMKSEEPAIICTYNQATHDKNMEKYKKLFRIYEEKMKIWKDSANERRRKKENEKHKRAARIKQQISNLEKQLCKLNG